MDDFQFLLYVVFGVIYLISKALGKKKPKRKVPPPSAPSGEGPSEPAMTFEEILRELTGQKNPQPRPLERMDEVIEEEPYLCRRGA